MLTENLQNGSNPEINKLIRLKLKLQKIQIEKYDQHLPIHMLGMSPIQVSANLWPIA